MGSIPAPRQTNCHLFFKKRLLNLAAALKRYSTVRQISVEFIILSYRNFDSKKLFPSLHFLIAHRILPLVNLSRMSLVQAGRDLLVRGGVRELYQGLGVTLIGSMPSVGVYFGLYQFVKKQLDSRGNMSPYLSVAVSAGVGNFVARCGKSK